MRFSHVEDTVTQTHTNGCLTPCDVVGLIMQVEMAI